MECRFILSKDETTMVNVSHIFSLYVSENMTALRVEVTNGKPWNIGKYNSRVETQKALDIVVNAIQSGKDVVVRVPKDEVVRSHLIQGNQNNHHITGKKTKGHGGS